MHLSKIIVVLLLEFRLFLVHLKFLLLNMLKTIQTYGKQAEHQLKEYKDDPNFPNIETKQSMYFLSTL